MGRAARRIALLGGRGGLGFAQRPRHAVGPCPGQVEVELGPLRARDRPFVLVAEMIRAVTGADSELHRRLLHHTVVDVLEPVIEELELVAPPILGIERVVVRAAMNTKLLVLRGGAHVALGRPAQVQSHARPIANRPHGQIDFLPLRLPPIYTPSAYTTLSDPTRAA